MNSSGIPRAESHRWLQARLMFSDSRSRGPRALDDSWSRFWHLAYNIARSEFKLKFFGSALGYLWQVMRPLLLFGVLYVVLRGDLPRRQGQRCGGPPLWRTVARLDRAVHILQRSDRERRSQRGRSREPRPQDPVPTVGRYRSRSCCSRCSTWALNLVVVMVFAVVEGVRPMLSWVELPLIIVMLTVPTNGCRNASIRALRALP